jgi:hypothetical protein
VLIVAQIGARTVLLVAQNHQFRDDRPSPLSARLEQDMITFIEAACLLVLVCAAPAFAQTLSQSTVSAAPLPAPVSEVARDDERPPDQSQAPSYRWYGWQTLSIDAAWIAMMLVADRGSVTGAELLLTVSSATMP